MSSFADEALCASPPPVVTRKSYIMSSTRILEAASTGRAPDDVIRGYGLFVESERGLCRGLAKARAGLHRAAGRGHRRMGNKAAQAAHDRRPASCPA